VYTGPRPLGTLWPEEKEDASYMPV
jgi:hypothetical protein